LALACVKPTPEQLYKHQLTQRLSKLETEFAEYEKKILAAKADAGRAQSLVSQRELLKSRMERLRAMIDNERFEAPPGPPPN